MAPAALDARAFRRFFAAGTWCLRRERGVLNGLNVFPVPDGDTGSNMYLTARAGLRAAAALRDAPLAAVAAAVAEGSLLGARGNSGVILSGMLRGFAQHVGQRRQLDALQCALALTAAVAAARAALTNPVEGTIVSVAQAAADAGDRLARTETSLIRLLAGMVDAANAALERTPGQLPALAAAGVVDAGGAGFCCFLEGALGFVPAGTQRAAALGRRPAGAAVFTPHQIVGENRFCTEFVLEAAAVDVPALRDLLAPLGDSLIVAGAAPLLKVHLHTARPDDVQALAAARGVVTRLKVEDMARQHRQLAVEPAPQAFAVAAVVPGPGFERIARELGADVTIGAGGTANPSVEELLAGVSTAPARRVVLLANGPDVAGAAREAAARSKKDVLVVPSRNVVEGLAVLLALTRREAEPDPAAIAAACASVASAPVFFAGTGASAGGAGIREGAPAATIAGRLLTAPDLAELVRAVVRELAGTGAGLATLYYGGRQTERDAQQLAASVEAFVPGVSVEWYYGGQTDVEYWISFER